MLSQSYPMNPDSRSMPLRTLLLCSFLSALSIILPNLAVAEQEQYWIYTIRPGDTLASLSYTHCKHLDDWKTLQSFNSISNVQRIPVGSKLKFPLSLLKYQPADASVTAISGEVSIIRHGQSDPVPLTTKQRLQMGDVLVTGNNAQITILFADGSELVMHSHSKLRMDTLSAWGSTGMVDTRLHLQSGRVEIRVKPGNGPGRYEISTPAAVAAVRGTKFRVSADEVQFLMRSETTEGTVSVINAYGESEVKKGYGQLAIKGQKMAAPKALLPATDLQNNQSVHHLPPYHFNWPEIDKSLVYQVHLSSKTGVHSYKVGNPETTVSKLDDGEYMLSVRGIDELGLQGISTSFNFHVFNPPEAPALLNDLEKNIFRTATPKLGWQPVAGAQNYRVQLATNQDFSAPIFDASLPTSTFTPPQALTPGKYFWRVASTGSNGVTGRYSDASFFSYYPQLLAPTSLQITSKPGIIEVVWTEINGAQRYELELASDNSFNSIIEIVSTPSPRGILGSPLQAGTYFVRLKARNAIGEYGPYSATQIIEAAVIDRKPFYLFSLSALLLLLL